MKKLRKLTALLAAAVMLTGAAALPPQNAETSTMLTASADAVKGTYESLTYVSYGDYIEITGCAPKAEAVVIPAEIEGVPVTGIAEDAFYFCPALVSVTIPESVTSIGERAFAFCEALGSVDIPDSVTEIGVGAFAHCSGLVSVAVPDSISVLEESVFMDCTGLTSVTLPDKLTAIGKNAFYGCAGLSAVTLPEGLKSIGGSAFYECRSLTSVTVPAGVEEIGDYAFRHCNQLTDIDVMDGGRYSSIDGVLMDGSTLLCYPEGKTEASYTVPASVKKIGMHAFSRVYSLETVTLPEGLTEIGWFAFDFCMNLTSITIPESLGSVGAMAFLDCTGLTTVTLSRYTTCIEDGAFIECENLADVWYAGTVKDWNAMEVRDGNEPLLEADIHFTGMPEVPVFGDADGDGVMSLADVVLVNKYLMIGEKLPEQMKEMADVDRNGIIDEVDALNILKAIIKLVELPLTE